MLNRQLTLAAVALFGWATIAPAQAPMSNADLIKLSKAGLSEDFIINSIQQQGSGLSTDVTGLIEMKEAGVSERVLREAVKKSPPREPLNTDSVLRLARARFGDEFLANMIRDNPGRFSTDASTVV